MRDQIERRLQYWLSTVFSLGIILFPFISIADYYRAGDKFVVFAGYRIGVTLVLIASYFLNKLKRGLAYQYTLIVFTAISSAITIELMIMSLGGHQSTYYAGINLLIIIAIGLLPYNLWLAIIVAVSIYAIYLIPIFLYDNITNVGLFVENNVFMVATFGIALAWRLMSQKSMLNELNLQYDLTEEKNKLEREVQLRTKELYQSEQWHRSLFENATDGIMVMDSQGIIRNVNDQACDIHGFTREALVGTQYALLEAAESKNAVNDRLARLLDGETMFYETEHYRKDGKHIAVEISAKAITLGDDTFIQSFQRDVTEKKKIRDHLIQSQKMDSIGLLAGGIAHDFKNVLTAILGFIGSIMKENIPSEKIGKRLRVMERTAQNASRMVDQLLGFARKSEVKFVPLNLRDMVNDVVKLLEGFIEKNIQLEIHMDEGLPIINGDISQLEQVLMNLVMNARDAMPDGGTVVISARVAQAGADYSSLPPYIRPGSYVEVSVADTGCGMSEEVKEKIFEPFFTTKDRGKGTGLGLSMVYGAVNDHHGYITVKTKPNRGTTFRLYFPVSAKSPATAVSQEPEVYIAPDKLTGTETILVVDDDENVLTYIKDTLESGGYKAIATSSPMHGIDIFNKMPDQIDLVITDVIMPLIDGGELMRQVRSVKPDIQVLTISAYRDFGDRVDDMTATPFLQKPFSGSSLLATIRRLLDSRQKDHR